MAMIFCKNCGKPISSKAKYCPQCHTKNKSKTPMIIGIITGIVLLIALIILLIVLLNGNKGDNSDGNGNNMGDEVINVSTSEYSNSKFSLKFPSTCSFIPDDGGYYVYIDSQTIPYVFIYNYSSTSDISKVFSKLKSDYSSYSNFTSTNMEKVNFYSKTYDHITFTYTIQDQTITDNRYAIVYNNTVWLYTTKEAKNRGDDASVALKVILKSFEVK